MTSGNSPGMLRGGFAACFAVALLVGCGARDDEPKPQLTGGFNATEVAGLDYGKGIRIRDTAGTPREVSQFHGKVVLVFFGFTSCPEICPVTLTRLAQVRKSLGPAGRDLQVLFVTVDPERDLAPRLQSYTRQFDADFIALRPEPAELPAVLSSFHAIAVRVQMPGSDDYMMDHSAVQYVYDKAGRLRLIAASDLAQAALQKDLARLLHE